MKFFYVYKKAIYESLKRIRGALEIGILLFHSWLYFLKGGLISIWRCRNGGCSTKKVLLKVTDTEF
jgi:hypothetical protein